MSAPDDLTHYMEACSRLQAKNTRLEKDWRESEAEVRFVSGRNAELLEQVARLQGEVEQLTAREETIRESYRQVINAGVARATAAESALEAMRAALEDISQPHDHKDGKPYSHTEELTFVRHLARAALNPLPPEQADAGS